MSRYEEMEHPLRSLADRGLLQARVGSHSQLGMRQLALTGLTDGGLREIGLLPPGARPLLFDRATRLADRRRGRVRGDAERRTVSGIRAPRLGENIAGAEVTHRG